LELEKASNHKSAKTHVGNVFVTRDNDLRPPNPTINAVLRLIMKHFPVKFCDPSCIGV